MARPHDDDRLDRPARRHHDVRLRRARRGMPERADDAFSVLASDDDVIPDLGDGDDGSCTAPDDEPLDCGEGDITPEEADPDEFQARGIATTGFGIADDTHLSEFNMFDGSALFDA